MIPLLCLIFVVLFAVAPYPADVWIAGVGLVVCSVAFVASLESERRNRDEP